MENVPCRDCGNHGPQTTKAAIEFNRCDNCQKERDEDMAYRLRQEHAEKSQRRFYNEHSTYNPTDGKA